jgi:predicted metal-dependent hydrolase
MIDWLRREISDPTIEITGRELPVAIRRHPRAKRMTLRLAPDASEVRLTLPRWGRTADGLEFVKSRRDWLEAQLAKQPQAVPPVSGGTISYRGGDLLVDWSATLPRKPLLVGAAIRLGGPQAGMANRLQRWLESEAFRLLDADLAHYCVRADREPPLLRLSRAQRRWGSCSTGGTIRINWRLIQAPDEVRRSVVAHEVAHMVHFDHSAEFHTLLGQLFEGDLGSANAWLKHNGRSLYASFG